jgi:hypothetical protein
MTSRKKDLAPLALTVQLQLKQFSMVQVWCLLRDKKEFVRFNIWGKSAYQQQRARKESSGK